MDWLRKPMLEAIFAADLIEATNTIAGCPPVPVAGQIGKLDAVSVRVVWSL